MRLIDADKIDMEDMDFHSGQRRECACEAAQDIIDAQPTVDAEPIIYAHWTSNEKFPLLKHCSACGYEPDDDRNIDTYDNSWLTCEFERCPICGAHMG